MSEELYFSKSKGKHIKIAEMPDVHVRRAFIKMNKEKDLQGMVLDELRALLYNIGAIIKRIVEGYELEDKD